MRAWILLLAAACAEAQKPGPPPPSDLKSVEGERDPEKRYWLALEFADGRIQGARKSYQESRIGEYTMALTQVGDAVKLCDDSLRSTGKTPSKSPKHFKRAELRIRELLRRLKGLEDEVSFEDRDPVKAVRTRVQELHDELLFDIMGRRK